MRYLAWSESDASGKGPPRSHNQSKEEHEMNEKTLVVLKGE